MRDETSHSATAARAEFVLRAGRPEDAGACGRHTLLAGDAFDDATTSLREQVLCDVALLIADPGNEL